MPTTYYEFKDKLRREIWVFPGEAKSLKASHDAHFQEAMLEMARWVPCLKDNNTKVHPACSTMLRCGVTVIPAVRGDIKYVYTIANGEYCDPVFLDPANYDEIIRWSHRLMRTWVSPSNTGLPSLPQGFKYHEAESDSPYGRARQGLWAIYRGRLYVAPWIQSNEKVVVEWDGEKNDWGDEDLIDDHLWDRNIQAAIKLYVRYAHERDFGEDPQAAREFKREFDAKMADAMYWCDQWTKTKPKKELPLAVRYPSADELEAEEVPDDTTKTEWLIANIGDYGKPTNGTFEEQVADLVKGWNPDFITANGDNIYTPTTSYAVSHAPYYGEYLSSDLTLNRFWTVLGNHDHTDPAGGVQDYYDYFGFPNNGRYYDFIKGPIHFFMYHGDRTEGHEPDGMGAGSVQAEWLKAKLALSTAKWKVVIVQDAPYTDHAPDNPGWTVLRLPFKDWGADLVISGDTHAWERYEVDGFPYIVNGAGGATIDTTAANDPALVGLKLAGIYSTYGAMKMQVTCESMICEFIDLTGTVLDSLTLAK